MDLLQLYLEITKKPASLRITSPMTPAKFERRLHLFGLEDHARRGCDPTPHTLPETELSTTAPPPQYDAPTPDLDPRQLPAMRLPPRFGAVL